jgi:hypothetical protein
LKQVGDVLDHADGGRRSAATTAAALKGQAGEFLDQFGPVDLRRTPQPFWG